ncbi:MAG: undecaprenyl-diphosphate phosphatase [Flavobacteriaceae bacterium]|nr:undecaprenyl-diphosphate phosphatase [Flavobacteriaceae bacterium]MBL6684930.1 undecaprenyl-diphosphate phosphatase [Flavobacteriaceae bacterium]
MDILKSLLLGIIQGLTEFLPVSSSGHLEIFKVFLDFSYDSTNSLFFTLIVHLATALSAIIYFWKDVKEIIMSLICFKKDENTFFAFYIFVSMIPAGLAGYFFESEINYLFNGNLTLVGFMLILTSLILYLSDRFNNSNKKLNLKSSLIIGFTQALAILPGISRSGATIGTSIFLGLNRNIAAKFSFLMVVPVIFGSSLKIILDNEIEFNNNNISNYLVGFSAALISGYYACKWMIIFVKKSKLIYFSIYCLLIGILSIIYSILNG